MNNEKFRSYVEMFSEDLHLMENAIDSIFDIVELDCIAM